MIRPPVLRPNSLPYPNRRHTLRPHQSYKAAWNRVKQHPTAKTNPVQIGFLISLWRSIVHLSLREIFGFIRAASTIQNERPYYAVGL
jgi:hypothetical protein